MKVKRRTIALFKKWTPRVGGLLALCLLFYFYFITSVFTITSYELVGIPDAYKDTVESGLVSQSQGKAYKIFPLNKVLSFPSDRIQSLVVSVLPNTESVKLRPVGLHTVRVTVKQFVPLFKTDDAHGVTKDGHIYAEFKDISSVPLLSIASSTTSSSTDDGIVTYKIDGFDEKVLLKLSTLIQKVNSVVFPVSEVYVDPYGDVSFFAENRQSRVMFALDADGTKVWSNIVSAIDTEPLKSKLLHDKDKLEYLDARFGNKVFYKFTNGVKIDIIASTTPFYDHATSTTTTLSH